MPACTVTSRAVVGSSAIRTSGSQLIAIAIIARWSLAAGELVRVGLRDPGRIVQPHRLEEFDHAGHPTAACGRSVWAWSASAIWNPIVKTGLKAVHRLLEDRPDLAATQLLQPIRVERRRS